MEYLIRPCTNHDLQNLVQLCSKHSEYENVCYNPNGKQELLEIALFSEHPKLFCFVIEISGTIQGYFTYTFDYSTWDAQIFLYLDCLYIEPDYRGYKIGEEVFNKLLKIAKQNKCVNIQWQTPVFNDRAIKFYNRVGGFGKEKVRFFIDTSTETFSESNLHTL